LSYSSSSFISKQLRAIRPLTGYSIQQCIHDTILELYEIHFAIFYFHFIILIFIIYYFNFLFCSQSQTLARTLQWRQQVQQDALDDLIVSIVAYVTIPVTK